MFDGQSLSHASFKDADLTGCDLRGIAPSQDTELKGAILKDVNLSGVDLRGSDLTGADVSGATLDSADLSKATLKAAKLIRTSLNHTNLARADLTGAVIANLGEGDGQQDHLWRAANDE